MRQSDDAQSDNQAKALMSFAGWYREPLIINQPCGAFSALNEAAGRDPATKFSGGGCPGFSTSARACPSGCGGLCDAGNFGRENSTFPDGGGA